MLIFSSQAALRTASLAILMVATLLGSAAQAFQGQPHLLFFTNDGCAPCKMVEPHIESLKRAGYPITVVHVSQRPELADRFKVYSTPTILLFDGNQKLRGRQAGLFDAALLKQWFAAVGMPNPPAQLASSSRSTERSYAPGAGAIKNRHFSVAPGDSAPDAGFSSATMHHGTARPETEAERRAMNATVRLKVEDTGGYSYATGTIIHAHGNEALVMTCGHVFRDSQGKGVITVEYDFYRNPRRARGRLIDYDSDARDVGLVAIRTDEPLEPAILAVAGAPVPAGADVFSIGCDHGEDPTIRHTRIKRTAKYDGERKYDIYGKPKVGRSGGGLFTNDGRLIGVCNAAAVEVDEGIYSALDTLHWQVANVGLSHLFEDLDRPQMITSGGQANGPRPDRWADSRSAAGNERSMPPASALRQNSGMKRIAPGTAAPQSPPQTFARDTSRTNPNSGGNVVSQPEVSIKVNAGNGQVREIKISNPTPELIQYLNQLK